MSYAPQFTAPRQRFTLHNSSPEPVILTWGGIRFTVPPVDQVHPYDAAKDADGDLIPGTLIVQDGYGPDRDGTIPVAGPYNWSASEAVKNVLGIDEVGDAVSSYANKGISFLPENPSKGIIREIRAEGEIRYQQHMIEWANYSVQAYQTAVDRAGRAGVAAPPPGKDYARAIMLLQNQNQRMAQELAAVAPPKPAEEEKPVDRTKDVLDLLSNPEIRAALKAEGFVVRKKGYAEGADLKE